MFSLWTCKSRHRLSGWLSGCRRCRGLGAEACRLWVETNPGSGLHLLVGPEFLAQSHPRFSEPQCRSLTTEKTNNPIFLIETKFFLMWAIFKSLLNLLQYSFCFVSVFWLRGMWGLCRPTGFERTPSALEGEVLTTGPSGKCLQPNF